MTASLTVAGEPWGYPNPNPSPNGEGREQPVKLLITYYLLFRNSNAFASNKLTEVTIGNSVETIGEAAFFKNKLKEVTIPYSVKKIERGAFTNNDQNLIVNIPDRNPDLEISDYAFDEGVNVIQN